MDLKLKGKVAMVAASSKGLGYGIAQALAQEGATISIGSRTEKDIEAAAEVLRKETEVPVLASVLDSSNAESIRQWTADTIKKFGGVDKLVVNAGGPPAGKFEDFSDADWQSAFELNLFSAVRMIRGVLPSMRERGGGSILTVTSMSVKEPIDVLILSNVMRSGVTSLVKSLSAQLAPDNIRLNNLMPGRINTDRVRSLDSLNSEKQGITIEQIQTANQAQIPLGRYGNIEEFGRTGAFLLSDAASYITGSSLAVDGGVLKTVW
ncbi:MAG: SDR family oxidoreductase [SAR324 cluster bacterium]|nr:SDR family oxidoreductase [SAR324 cluster bacterium]MBL7034460.1 SDR family oxidoreductase [SAR324 cluster bacterium]